MVRALLVAGLVAFASLAPGAEVTPLPQAHAHNDYYHKRPLLDALDQGFCGVEADIFLIDGKLLVGHSKSELKPERTLQKLYLDPLRQRVRKNGGKVYAGAPEDLEFTLLIDIKSEGEATYRALAKVLAEYSDILTEVRGKEVTRRAVTAVISGNRAKEVIAASDPRYAGIDGRLSDLDSKQAASLMPLISDRWGSHFKWRGSGKMPAEERRKLDEIVQKAHANGQRVRFWATPEKETMWKQLQLAGVDLINTDDLEGLKTFLENPN